jgi:predicted Zn finger-like uncharacterized protein
VNVQCPQCHTQYRVPDERLSHRRPTFKCTQCGHVFPGERSAPTARARESDKNLSFTFDPPGEDGGSARASSRGGDERAAPSAPLAPPSVALRTGGEAEEPAFVAAASRGRSTDEDATAVTRAAHSRRIVVPLPDDVPDLDRGDEDADPDEATAVLISAPPERAAPIRPRTAAATKPPKRSPLQPVTLGVALTLAAYLGLALYLDRRPDLTLETLVQVPLLGRLIGDDNLLAWRLELVDVQGELDQIRGRRPAYIVSGRAVNTTGEPLRIIQVEGRLLAGGTVRQQRRAYAANQFKKTVRELSASEVEMLLRLEPNRRFVVQPGESAQFLIVFPDPPADMTGVECRVVDARAT